MRTGLALLPDSTPCYVPGVGEVTLGEVRRTEENPALVADREATLRMWADRATRNLCRDAWESTGASPSGRRA